MIDTNYILTIVKILENPYNKILNENTRITEFRVQIPQIRNRAISKVIFWGNLACEIKKYYKINDHIIIEGYLSLAAKSTSNLNQKKIKKVEINVLKIYPFSYKS